MAETRPERLPGGKLTRSEVAAFYGQEFADRAFALVERMQAGDQVAFGELMDLYFDWAAKNEGKAHIILDPEAPKGYSGHPDEEAPLAVPEREEA